MLGSSADEARYPLGVLPLTVSIDGSDATLALRVDVKPTTAHWIIAAESTWLTADSGVFEEPIVQGAEDVNGSPSTRVVSCALLLSSSFLYVSAHSKIRHTRCEFEHSTHANGQNPCHKAGLASEIQKKIVLSTQP